MNSIAVLEEARRQIGFEYDKAHLEMLEWKRGRSDNPSRSYEYLEGLGDGLDIAWQVVDEIISKLEDIENDG